ncbi:MAG: MarR family transcriptional regulator [Burkholderiales bacterium]|nr:MarR family transcriptional regulator [Burkholderiales bacterium]
MSKDSKQGIRSKKKEGKGSKGSPGLQIVQGGLKVSFESPLSISKDCLLDGGYRTDRKFRQLLYDLSVFGKLLEAARAHLSSHIDLLPSQYNIVMLIAQYQGEKGVSVTEIAQHLHAAVAFVTSEVKKLEALDLVRKTPNPNDGRSNLLQLTRAGQTKVLGVAHERLYVNDQLFRNLAGDDFDHLSRIVAHLICDFAETIETLEGKRKNELRRSARLIRMT